MNEQTFSIGEVLRIGWEGWKKHWVLLISLLIISILLAGFPHLLFANGWFKTKLPSFDLSNIIGYLIAAYVNLGMLNVTLKIARKEEADFKDFFNTFPYYIQYLLGQILFTLIVSVGLILLVIPGIIFFLKFFLYPYFIIEKKLWPIEAFKESNQAIFGAKWDLLLFLILSVLINLLGLLCLVIGLFVTVPVLAIAQAAIYVSLQSRLAEIAQR